MGPLGSSLQGQYEKTTENKKHMTLLVKKLPLTLVQKRTCGLRKEITLKFYYKSCKSFNRRIPWIYERVSR